MHRQVHPITRDLKNSSVFYTPPAPLFAMNHGPELGDFECVLIIRRRTWAESVDLVLRDFPKNNKLR